VAATDFQGTELCNSERNSPAWQARGAVTGQSANASRDVTAT